MENNEIFNFLEKPCRFKLKGGKEVYGVIWKENSEELYFTSSKEFEQYKQSKSNISKYTLSPDEVVYAEMLKDLDRLDN
ncbi:MAG: hypothetical protein D6707_06540 [Bacteroidetes bacterium]|nr:MAG: hypothetical protein D6707_06540 [Bacteroidota bacterium]